MKKQTNYKPVAPVLHPNANIRLKEQIAQRAFELWLYRGQKLGNALADWLQAEREINEWHRRRAQATTKPAQLDEYVLGTTKASVTA